MATYSIILELNNKAGTRDVKVKPVGGSDIASYETYHIASLKLARTDSIVASKLRCNPYLIYVYKL